MAGGARHGLGEHAALEVEDAGGEVAGLAHGGAEGGADHGLRLLLHHRDQAVPHDLALDGGEGGVHGAALLSQGDIAVRVDAGRPARRHQGGGLSLGDDGGAGEPRAGAQRRAVVDTSHGATSPLALSRTSWVRARVAGCGAGAQASPGTVVGHGRDGDREAHDLHVGAWHGAVVEPGVLGVVFARGSRPRRPAAVEAVHPVTSVTAISWPCPT